MFKKNIIESTKPELKIIEYVKEENLVSPEEKILFHGIADLDENGLFKERHLIITEKKLLVIKVTDRSFKTLFNFSLKEISSAEAKPMVGSGEIIIQTKKKELIHLISYSNALADVFSVVAKELNHLLKNEEAEFPDFLPPPRCEKCGRLLPGKNEKCRFCIHYLHVMQRILLYLKPYTWKTILAVLFTTAATLLQLIPPLITKKILDQAIPSKNSHLLGILVLLWLAVQIFHTIIIVFNNGRLAWLGGRVGTDIRHHVFSAIEKLSLSFFDKYHVGQIMARIMNDSNQLQGFLIEGFPYLANNALTIIGIIIILFRFSPLLASLILIPVPLMFIGQAVFWKIVRVLDHRWWNQYSRVNSRLAESLSGMKVVKAFSQEEREISLFSNQNEGLFNAQFKADRFWAVFFPSMGFFVSSGVLIVWFVGGRQVMAGTLTLGTLVAFISYLWMFYGPLQWFNQVNNWMTRAFVGAERIFETIDTKPEDYLPSDAKSLKTIKGKIEFKNVSFSYEKGKPALKDISFVIQPGEMIGLVGKSGSGKSTLLALLCRFYEPDEGEILIDDIPIKKIPLKDLRKHVGLVLQDPYLFSASIMENIAYSKHHATFEEIMTSSKAANAHDFIMTKPDAYDSRVGERGNRLSGGEKQRISIARAILHNPRILIFDEATSSVDSETEMQIQQAMDKLVKNRTTIVAAHRLSTLRNADRLFVLEEGRLVECGTHEQLIRKKKSVYARLLRIQERKWRKSRHNLSITGEMNN